VSQGKEGRGESYAALRQGVLPLAGLPVRNGGHRRRGSCGARRERQQGQGTRGRGLALAKGHAKRAAAAPQTPQAPVKPASSGKNEVRPKSVAPKAQPGVDRRASHLTICHRTGSGRYVVISPSVTGATKGHLTKHDDFVFTGSCSRPTEVLSPSAEPPATGEHEPPSRMGGRSRSRAPRETYPSRVAGRSTRSLPAAC
jgi:hypothetical protein